MAFVQEQIPKLVTGILSNPMQIRPIYRHSVPATTILCMPVTSRLKGSTGVKTFSVFVSTEKWT